MLRSSPASPLPLSGTIALDINHSKRDFLLDHYKKNQIAFIPWVPMKQNRQANEMFEMAASDISVTSLQVSVPSGTNLSTIRSARATSRRRRGHLFTQENEMDAHWVGNRRQWTPHDWLGVGAVVSGHLNEAVIDSGTRRVASLG